MAAPAPKVGETLGSYRLEALLGRGGMGSVYLASHTHLAKRAAIKILAPDLAADPSFRSRFLTEARLISEVDAPGIVDILDVIEQDTPPRIAYVMEFIDGPTLRRELDRVPFTPVQAARIGIQLARALEAIHAQSVVHRDVKPGNILVTARIETNTNLVPVVKLVDFGIAKAHGRPAPQHQTAAGSILGTPAYMAPEQVTGEPTSWETDIYALGEVLHEMFTRRRVFPENARESFRLKLERVPPPIEPLPFAGGREIAELIRRCVEPDIHRRPTHRELIQLLSVIGGTGAAIVALEQNDGQARNLEHTHTFDGLYVPLVQDPPTSPSMIEEVADPPAAAHAKRRPSATVALAGVTLMLGVGVGVLWEPEPPTEQTPATRRIVEAPPKPPPDNPGSAKVMGLVGTRQQTTPVLRAGPAPRPAAESPKTVVEVELRSRPSGAIVVDADTDTTLGQTPLRLKVRPSLGARVRFSLPGHRSETVFVDGQADRELIRLKTRPKKRKDRRLRRAAKRPPDSQPRRPPPPVTKKPSPAELLPW